jgi:hypothetical protein
VGERRPKVGDKYRQRRGGKYVGCWTVRAIVDGRIVGRRWRGNHYGWTYEVHDPYQFEFGSYRFDNKSVSLALPEAENG